MVTSPRRYEALDALRGICALLVALFHLKSTGAIAQLAFVRNGWLFVDFFFVLSGFVIAASYGERLREGFTVGKFMALRLGRVYPLHLFMLGVFAAFECFKLLVGDKLGLSQTQAWQSPNGPLELAQSISLTQIFGFADDLSWNGPSWSIAAEVWTYLLMALVLAAAGRRAGIAIAAIATGSGLLLLALGEPYINRTFTLSLVRCLYGFSLGMLVFSASRRQAQWFSGAAATMAEWLAIGIVIGLVMMVDPANWMTLLAPLVFALAVMVFSHEKGAVSRALMRSFPLMLGLLSYSIYMVHVFVEARMIDIALVLAGKTGLPLASLSTAAKVLGTPNAPWMGDVMTLVTLAVIVAGSWITFHIIELPCRNVVRRRFA